MIYVCGILANNEVSINPAIPLVVELSSRRVVGSALSLSPDAKLVSSALRNALETRKRVDRLLFHSDQGCQYKSKRYRQLLWRNGVMQSMSRRGNCLDNSPMEGVFRRLKSEWFFRGDTYISSAISK